MAVSVGATIQELTAKARQFGIYDKVTPSGKNGKIKKEDLISPLRDYYLADRYGSVDKTPEHMKMMLQVKSPMLAMRADKLKDDLVNEIWESEEWLAEEKLNGVRCWIVNDGNGIRLYSRHNSDVDLLPIEFTEKILFPDNCDLSKISKKFIIDCEMTSDEPNICTIVGGYGVVTESVLQAVTSLISSDTKRAKIIQQNANLRLVFNSFDCVYYDGQWIINEPYKKRKEVAEELIQALENCGFNIRRVRSTTTNKRQFYHDIISTGGEGIIAKPVNGIYIADTCRNSKGWIKFKRSMSEAMANSMDDYGDTIDAWISGFTLGNKGTAFENYIGSVEVSVNLIRSDGSITPHVIGSFSGIPMSLREDMTYRVNGEPTLNPSYYNRVVEVDGANMTKNLKLAHCQFLGFRYDKGKDECVMEQAFLESKVL